MSIIEGMEGQAYACNWGDPACASQGGSRADRTGWVPVKVQILSTADLLEVASWVRDRFGDLSEGRWDMTVATEQITVWFQDKSAAMMFKLTYGGL